MNRRGFLKGMAGILAAGMAPTFARGGGIMRIRPIVLLPEIAPVRASGMYATAITNFGPITKFISNREFSPPSMGKLILPLVDFNVPAGTILESASIELVNRGEVMGDFPVDMRGPEIFPNCGVFQVRAEISGDDFGVLTKTMRNDMLSSLIKE